MEDGMQARANAKDIENAKFLFKGTVQKLNASTLAHIPKNAQTAIVRVDEILHAPPALAKTLGKQITVKLIAGSKVKPNEHLLFHANGWLFGDSVAVEAVKQEKPQGTQTMLEERVSDPVRNLRERELANRVADAAMVIEGEVSSVHLPPAESITETPGMSSTRPVSEHDPKWREAVINVAAVHKGKPGAKQVVLRFPSSTDVQWHRAPKFHTGDRGVWLLQPSAQAAAERKAAKRKGPGKAALEEAAPMTVPGAPVVYTALHPMDFQPANKLESVAPVIRTAVAEKSRT
jgi:hypothetical protein